MKRPPLKLALATLTTVFLAAGVYSCAMQPQTETDESQRAIEAHAQRMIDEGRKIFRYDTFGSEAFWGATRLHDAIAGEKNGGAGPGQRRDTVRLRGIMMRRIEVAAPARFDV